MSSYSGMRLGEAGREASSRNRRADGDTGSRDGLAISRNEAPSTYRLAIGLFGSWGSLTTALGNLSMHELPVDSLCLIGIAPFDGDVSRPHGVRLDGVPDVYGALFDRVHRIDGLLSANAYAASQGTLLDDICRSLSAIDEDHSEYPSWLMGSQRERISAHLNGGGLVLVVSSGSPAQQDASTRILLRHSQHGVQTHDFTVRVAVADGHRKSQPMPS